MLSEHVDVRGGGRFETSRRRNAPSLQPVDPRRFPGWNRLCESHAEGSFFHSAEWMEVLAGTYRFTPFYLVSTAEEEPVAAVPMVEVAPFGRRKAVALPFTDFCEPLIWDEALDRRDLWRQLLEIGKARGWRQMEIRGARALELQGSPSLEFFGHLLDLTGGEARLFAGFDPGVRQAIRKAEREGVKVETSTGEDAVKGYYRLHCQTRKRHGLPPQPYRLFHQLHEHGIGNKAGFVATAMHRGVPVAGAVFVRFGGKGLFKFGASDRRVQHLRANDLVMWAAIRELLRNGVKSLHFGRTSISNEGLRRFKLGWGAEEQKIQYLTYDFRRAGFILNRDRAFGWHNRLFGAMPVWVARIAGSLLYKRFA